MSTTRVAISRQPLHRRWKWLLKIIKVLHCLLSKLCSLTSKMRLSDITVVNTSHDLFSSNCLNQQLNLVDNKSSQTWRRDRKWRHQLLQVGCKLCNNIWTFRVIYILRFLESCSKGFENVDSFGKNDSSASFYFMAIDSRYLFFDLEKLGHSWTLLLRCGVEWRYVLHSSVNVTWSRGWKQKWNFIQRSKFQRTVYRKLI